MTSTPVADGPSITLPLRPAARDESRSSVTGHIVGAPQSTDTRPHTEKSGSIVQAADSTKPHVTFAEPDGDNETQRSEHTKEGDKLQGANEAISGDDSQHVTMQSKKKKRSKGKKGKKGSAGPSGFEEYYVDTPVTPAEYNTEEELYHPAINFSDRIQIAIQRYSAKRKFDETRRALWIKYLAYGGISSGPKMFGSNDDADLEDLSAADKITLRATEYVSTEIVADESMRTSHDDHDPMFVVDFDGVLRAFLSLYLRSTFDVTKPDAVKVYCGLLRNWLNYLLHHNVCNDFRENLLAARKTVDIAEVELIDMIDLPSLLPGTFSAACKSIYIAPLSDIDNNFSWGSTSNLDGFSKENANRIFLAALASLGSDELCDHYSDQNEDGKLAIVERVDTGLEVTGVFPSSKQTRDMYAHPSNHGLTPMGWITAKTWWCPWAGTEDLTEEEEAALPAQQAAASREYTIWMDDDTLAKIHTGLKMTADICKLSFGLWFVENVKLMYPSYTIWIPNEIMEGWREHEYIPPKKNVQGEEELSEQASGQIDNGGADGGAPAIEGGVKEEASGEQTGEADAQGTVVGTESERHDKAKEEV